MYRSGPNEFPTDSTDYSRLLRVALVFVACPPQQRAALLPNVWRKPAEIDDGLLSVYEQPRHFMACFCAQWLKLQEFWEDLPAYTTLSLQSPEVQREVESRLTHLRYRAEQLPWREWADSSADVTEAAELLNLLNFRPELTREQLDATLDGETYGTFTRAFTG